MYDDVRAFGMQAANRINFNQPEEEFLDGDDVVGLGVLGKEGSGRLRAQVGASFADANPPVS
jgi:hypothetical protein